MKLALAMMTKNCSGYLRLHLPKLLESAAIAGLITIDDDSIDDTVEVVESFGGKVYYHALEGNYSAQCNRLIAVCEALGFDALLRLDPDECMFPNDINSVLYLLQEWQVVRLARYNFWKDRLHWTKESYPDWQGRAFLLRRGVYWQGKVHEQLYIPPYIKECRYGDAPIYHYGDIGSIDGLKHYNYDRMLRGLEPVNALPDDAPDNFKNPCRPSDLFEGKQPIDPLVVGVYAPKKFNGE